MSVNFLEPQYPYQGKNRKKMMTVIFLSLAVSVLLIGSAVWAGGKIFNKKKNAPVTFSQKLQPIDTNSFVGKVKSFFAQQGTGLIGADQDRINVALFGVGGDGHEGGQLTDTIVIASIKPSTKQIALISIPRDTMVEIPGFGFRKVNEANAQAEMIAPGTGGEKATQVIDNFLGIEIPYYIRIDFGGFQELIDDIGGIDVYVDKPFTDYQFPTLDYKYRTISFSKGWHHMDGATALDYSRSRHGNNFEGSDFARARRQQKVLLAARDKILSGDTLLHPTRITDILQTLDTHIQMNIRFNDIIAFMQLAKELNTDELINVVFSDDPASVLYSDNSTGGFYLKPRDPSLAQIHHVAQDIFNPETSHAVQGLIDMEPLQPQKIKEAKIEIQNGTWRPGFASRQKKKLVDDGYQVTAIGNAATRPVASAQIYDVTKRYPDLVAALKKQYSASDLTERPSISPDNVTKSPMPVDIIVILGENVPDIAE